MKYSRLGLVRIDAFNHFLSDAFEQMQYAALRGLARDQLAGLRTGSLERPQRGDAVLDQGLHAVAMKPEQPHRQLPQIVALDPQAACARDAERRQPVLQYAIADASSSPPW